MSDIVTLNGYKIKDEKAVRSYETVAQMKADTKLKEGYHVKTKGYYEANDGGHGEYIIVDDETLVDDGGSIHVLTNGLRAILISDGKTINVLQYGVKRNINESQNTLLANIIDKLTPGDTLFFPSGKYYFEEQIVLKNRINIEGEILSTGEKDNSFNGSRLFFDIQEVPDSRYTLLDCTQNNKTLIKNIYLYSTSYSLSCDRTSQSTDSTAVNTFTPTENMANIEGIRLSSYGSEVDNVIIRGCSLRGIYVGTYNLLNNVRIYECNYGMYLLNDNTINDCNCFTCNVGINIDGSINLINNFRADEVKRGIWCHSSNNNITNFNIDYALHNAIQIESGNNNYITGNIGRVGTYYAEKGSNIPMESCYIGLISSSSNRIDIISSYRNTKDTTPPINNPCYTIVTRGTCKYNRYTLTGFPKFIEETLDKLSLSNLKNLLTIQDGNNSDIVEFNNYIYSFNNTSSSYSNDTISFSHSFNKYSDNEVYNRIFSSGTGNEITIPMTSDNNRTFFIIVGKNGSSDRGVYVAGYSTATATLVVETIVALTDVSITKSGSNILISGVNNWSSALVLTNTNL